jgi:hypothetical protein
METLAPALLTTSEDVVAGLEPVAVPFAIAIGGAEAKMLAGLGATRIPVLVREIERAMLVPVPIVLTSSELLEMTALDVVKVELWVATAVLVVAADVMVMVLEGIGIEAEAPVSCALKPAKNRGEYVAVPSYAAHPGTVVFGGARPPPQSRGSQISPDVGT